MMASDEVVTEYFLRCIIAEENPCDACPYNELSCAECWGTLNRDVYEILKRHLGKQEGDIYQPLLPGLDK